MEKIVIFDWGGVILKEYPNHYCDRDAIADTLIKFNNKLSREEAYDLYVQTLYDDNKRIISTLNDYDSKYDWYKRINEKASLNTDYESFVNEMINNYKKIDKYDEVVNYINSLKGKVTLGLFSDLIFVCYDALCRQIDLNIFDYVFLSYEEGVTKYHYEAFINANEKLHGEDKDILFIDNSSTNVSNAKKIGWNVFQATGDDIEVIKRVVNDFLGGDNYDR